MKAPKFKEFIAEAETDKKPYRLIVVSDEPEESEYFHTAKRLIDEGGKLGHKVYVVMIDGAYITVEEGIRRVHNSDDKKGFVVDSSDTLAIIRGSITRKDSWLDFLSQLEKGGIAVVNSRSCVNTCADKYRTYLRLLDYGITQPRTVLIPNKDLVKQAVENLDSDYPMIMKTLRGSKGVGVLFIESERSLDSIVQLTYKTDEDSDLLLQEYIKTDHDVRVLVLGGKVMATMRRDVIEGDFRSNFSMGGVVKKYNLTELEVEQCILAAKAVNGVWVAVDFIPSKNREKQPPFIIEVNSSPGTEGIEKATEGNLVKQIVQHFEDPKNRWSVPTECGYREVVNIKPFGELIAKMDTGNSGEPVIHAEKIKASGNKVAWTLNGKTITSDIVRTQKIRVGGQRDYTEDRYVVSLDVEFLGQIYENTEFTLDDREDRTPILFDRAFMNRLNLMINPNRKYVVTTKYSLE